MKFTTSKSAGLALAGIFATALAVGLLATPAHAAVVLPGTGFSVTFEAEDYDAESGTSIITSAQASGSEYVDGLGKSAAGGGDTPFISFDVSNVDPSLTYTVSMSHRRNGGSNGNSNVNATYEFYAVSSGPTYTNETIVIGTWVSNGWNVDFYDSDESAGFQLAAGTTAIRIESLDNQPGDFNGIAHLDTFTINAIPEPASAGLLGLVIFGFLMIHRKRS